MIQAAYHDPTGTACHHDIRHAMVHCLHAASVTVSMAKQAVLLMISDISNTNCNITAIWHGKSFYCKNDVKTTAENTILGCRLSLGKACSTL